MSFNKYDAKKNILISSRVIPTRPETANIKNSNLNKKLLSNYKVKNSKSLMQSPKLRSNMFRPSSCKPKLISLLDVKTKSVARGTCIPSQYLRVSDEELTEITRRKINTKIFDKKKSLIVQQKILNTEVPKRKISINNKKLANIDNENVKTNPNIYISTEESNSTNNIPAKTERRRYDCWLPKGYENYEKCVKDNKYFKKILLKNNFIACVPTVTPKNIKEKSLKSDIFFLGPPSSKEISQNQVIENKNYDIKLKSDIFNRKNDELSLRKSSEYKILKDKKNSFMKNSHNLESKSSWGPANNFPTYFNSPSTEYSIICPNKKNIGSTKENIKVTNGCNPNMKQKSISEFYNLTKNRNGGTENFKKNYGANPNCFHKENNICTLFLDLRKKYEGICD